MVKLIALLLLITGLVFIANVAFPIASYELTKRSNLEERFISPLGDTLESLPDNSQVLGETTDWSKSIKTSSLIKPSDWFQGNNNLNPKTPIKNSIKYYTLSIPKLKINQATVEINGEDLSKSLVQYPGTALPGEKGNVVIFGHSILPQFFNPKNYLTIFSTLPTIKKGDEITLNYDGVTYLYHVTELFEVPPTALEVLKQYHDGEHITLITCVPPGTYLKRLVVRASLAPPEI